MSLFLLAWGMAYSVSYHAIMCDAASVSEGLVWSSAMTSKGFFSAQYI